MKAYQRPITHSFVILRQLTIGLTFILIAEKSSAQGSYLQYDADIYHLIDRSVIQAGHRSPLGLGAQRPYARQFIAELADSLMADSSKSKDRSWAAKFLIADNSEFYPDSITSRKPLARYFFRNEADLFSVSQSSFDVHISPAFYGQFGRESGANQQPYINTRGVEVRGTIDKRVSFYTFLADNQAVFPKYISDPNYAGNYSQMSIIGTTYPRLPYESFVKPNGLQGVDFITARGHISFNATKHIHFQLGQDRLFSGYGIRSLILSDYATAMPFVKAEVSVWKIKYSSTFAQLKAGGRRVNDDYIPNKWMSHHNFELAVLPNLHFNFFESIIYAPKDTNQRGVLELGYLNPIIFYRFAEQYQGSYDNALVGAGWRYDFWKRFRFYGQFVLDEFLLKNIKAQNGWWANKYAIQAGLKYINALNIKGLDLQGEVNVVRPYTYSHRSKYLNYTQYNLPLAHPLGANFTELVARLDYQPHYRVQFHFGAMLVKGGDDRPGFNDGANILYTYDTRSKEFGNAIGQGVKYTTTLLDARLTYMPWHRVFIELNYLYRNKKSDLEALSLSSQVLSLNLRWNIFYRQQWM